MIVCLCEGLSDREIRRTCLGGARTLDEISNRCGAGTHCGTCKDSLRKIARSCGGEATSRDTGTQTEMKIFPTA